MHRFFVAPELVQQTPVILPEKLAHQVRDVLHLGIGEHLLLLDNSGEELLCAISKSGRSRVEVEILERRVGEREPATQIILCQGLLKSARFEWILEKGTEIGVSTFVPTLCRRSMAGLEETGQAKFQRWQRILQEASEQSGRSRIPELTPVRPLMHALTDIPKGALGLMPWEEAQDLSLLDALRAYKTRQSEAMDSKQVVLFIGPEGGLIAEEVKLAQRQGVQIVSLGKRILRAETAALVTVGNVMYELE